MYAMKYYSAIKRNKVGSFVETWMVLQNVIQNEVSQKEKNKQHMIRYNCQIYKKWYRLFCFQNRNRITDLPKKKKKNVWTPQWEWCWCDELGYWDFLIYTIETMHQIDN